jgi:succinate-semialdehyde dehydrogenase/glutarate-semialdehyde dehydrogenase
VIREEPAVAYDEPHRDLLFQDKSSLAIRAAECYHKQDILGSAFSAPPVLDYYLCMIESRNPSNEQLLKVFEPHSSAQVESALLEAGEAFRAWRKVPFAARARLIRAVARILRAGTTRLGSIITLEMGKPIVEAEAEVEKCAWACEYYAENAERFLSSEPRDSNAGKSYIRYSALGPVLAVMPWNFPFWQVFRFAAPALMAGNAAILKHASNVPQCALAIEQVFRDAGLPTGVFHALLIPGSAAGTLIRDPRIVAVTLTGSEEAGSRAAELAGKSLKKSVLELGGSDPFIVLEDADVEAAARAAVRARFQNTGQSCIAAKRFVVVESVHDLFLQRLTELVRDLRVGEPTDRATQIGPLARSDLREELERQVRESLRQGARLVLGGARRPGPGYFFEPTILDDVGTEMAAGSEELFGPVAAVMRARNPADAIRIGNASEYGLGASLWSRNIERAEELAREIETGQVFINGIVASDPRLPFGGVKRSGYGRELSEYGIREFVNVQTVWIAR